MKSWSRRNFLITGFTGAAGLTFFGCHSAPEEAREKEQLPVDFAQGLCVYDLQTGMALKQENENTIIHPAGLTRLVVAAAYFEFKKARENQILQNERFKDELDKRTHNIVSPKTISEMDNNIRRMLIVSDNDATGAVARFLTQQPRIIEQASKEGLQINTEWAFGALVAGPLCKKLGMKNTRLYNATGLPGPETDTPHNKTTISDLKKLSYHILKTHPEILEITSEPYWGEGPRRRCNDNPLLATIEEEACGQVCEGVDGLRTGHIDQAGYQIIATAQRQGRRVVVISVGHKTEQELVEKVNDLIDKGFEELNNPLPGFGLAFPQNLVSSSPA